jgi:hypothetical protein
MANPNYSELINGVLYVRTAADLRRMTTQAIVKRKGQRRASLEGFTTAGDGSGGDFVLLESTAIASSNVIVPDITFSPEVRWLRVNVAVFVQIPLDFPEQSNLYSPNLLAGNTRMWAAASGQIFYRTEDGNKEIFGV